MSAFTLIPHKRSLDTFSNKDRSTRGPIYAPGFDQSDEHLVLPCGRKETKVGSSSCKTVEGAASHLLPLTIFWASFPRWSRMRAKLYAWHLAPYFWSAAFPQSPLGSFFPVVSSVLKYIESPRYRAGSVSSLLGPAPGRKALKSIGNHFHVIWVDTVRE